MSFLRFSLDVSDGYFWIPYTRPTGWTHIVMNYIGPNGGEGIRGYVDGIEVVSDPTKDPHSLPVGDRRIVVGESTQTGTRTMPASWWMSWYILMLHWKVMRFSPSTAQLNVKCIYEMLMYNRVRYSKEWNVLHILNRNRIILPNI